MLEFLDLFMTIRFLYYIDIGIDIIDGFFICMWIIIIRELVMAAQLSEEQKNILKQLEELEKDFQYQPIS